MDWSTIVSLISSVGFPILACVVMFKYMSVQEDRHREDIKELQNIVMQNTEAVNSLINKIDMLVNKKGW